MKILIIESTSKRKPLSNEFDDTSIVHCRNSLILAEALGADLLDGEYKLPQILANQYDVIICAYASPYMPHVPYREILTKNPSARYVWLVNDHDIEDNQLLRYGVINHGLKYDMICNNPRSGYRHWILNKNIAGKKLNDFIIEWLTVNLNSLIMDTRNPTNPADKDGIVYYGTYRKHRQVSFEKFLTEGVSLSCSPKNVKKFQAINCNCTYVDKLSWKKNEDVVMLFDAKCENTIKSCGYNLSPNIIIDENKLSKGLTNYVSSLNYEEELKHQRQFVQQAFLEKTTAIQKIKDFLK